MAVVAAISVEKSAVVSILVVVVEECLYCFDAMKRQWMARREV